MSSFPTATNWKRRPSFSSHYTDLLMFDSWQVEFSTMRALLCVHDGCGVLREHTADALPCL